LPERTLESVFCTNDAAPVPAKVRATAEVPLKYATVVFVVIVPLTVELPNTRAVEFDTMFEVELPVDIPLTVIVIALVEFEVLNAVEFAVEFMLLLPVTIEFGNM
jgi:hypothetical protein